MDIYNKLDKVSILVDFDGTITTEDTNEKLLRKYSCIDNNKKEKISKEFAEGKVDFATFFKTLIEEVKITETEYINFILNEIEISPGFVEFYNNTKRYNIPVTIVSGGFINGIQPFLKAHGITDAKVYANQLVFDKDNVSLKYYDGDNTDCCEYASCGNCKINRSKESSVDGQSLLFIGDGTTDKTVINYVDYIFAKDSLERYCIEKDVKYTSYKNFIDINNLLFNKY